MTSGSVVKAAELVVAKAKAIAAGLLEANPEDIVITDGRLHVRGSDEPSVTMRDVATAAYVRTERAAGRASSPGSRRRRPTNRRASTPSRTRTAG